MQDDRGRWNEKYRSETCEMPDHPIPELQERIKMFPDGRALEVATGMGRNALFLAEHGYTVDAFDISEEALYDARNQAKDLKLDVNWIQADADRYCYPEQRYHLVVVSFYCNTSIIPDIRESLAEDGALVYKTHLKTDQEDVRGPSSPGRRMERNQLLDLCRDMHVTYYNEQETETEDGRFSATATIVARRRCI